MKSQGKKETKNSKGIDRRMSLTEYEDNDLNIEEIEDNEQYQNAKGLKKIF